MLKDKYINDVVPMIRENMKGINPLRISKLLKVVVNMGTGIVDKNEFKAHLDELVAITGQKPVIMKAKKSISNFKLREGMNVGIKVTLRGGRMYDFLDRLINVSLPRIRDFRGVSRNSFDGFGNYTLGVKDQSIFPELDPNNINVIQGMDITIVTTANNNDEAFQLLKLLGMPFAEN